LDRSDGQLEIDRDVERVDRASSDRTPDLSDDALLSLANQLVNAGRADEALALLEREGTERRPPALSQLHGRLSQAIRVLRERAPDRVANGERTSIIALSCVLKMLAEARAAPAPSRRLRAVALITGHLGAGGAELQLSRTAEMLANSAGAQRNIGGVKVSGPIHVVVKSLAPDSHRTLDFFLPRLAGKGIPVWQMDDMPAIGPDSLSLENKDLEALLWLLHPSIRRGLCLAPWFRSQNIDVAYIWQDNPILHFAIAAMLAGVPRLVLNFRGMPPVLRWNEHLEDYRELYSALASMPGVTFVTNSRIAAGAYSKWISCSPESFHVIWNGGAPHASHPRHREIEMWSSFEERTRDANITIGAIFRMHPNKRPLEWIRFARRYLDAHRNARFILIGSGMLSSAVKELATELGIMHRLLLVRQTLAGDFWLKKMDAFVLLSRFEGTPNVLIEAQLAGVPVVCTPVANARDTFMEGITGAATSSCEFLDVEEVVSKVDGVLALARAGGSVREYALRHIESRFSARTMIEHTVNVLSGRDQKCCVRSGAH
jgi:glycosyltransferase involved in cell wall biosynthesis